MATFWYAAMREDCVYSRGLQCSHNRVSLEEMCVDFGILVDLHLHLEGVELLFDLLSKHGRESITCCNLSTTIILCWRMNIKELHLVVERNVTARIWKAPSTGMAVLVLPSEITAR